MRGRRRWRARYVSEHRAAHMLAEGGMVIERSGGWHVFRTRDARMAPAGRISAALAGRLIAEGALVPDQNGPGRWVARVVVEPAPEPVLPACHPLRFPVFAGRRAALPLLHAVLADTAYPLRERARLRTAANRFAADAEQAASSQPVTMCWDGVPAGSRSFSVPEGGPGGRARAAAARLQRLEAHLGGTIMRRLERLILEEARRRAFAGPAGIPVAEAGPQAFAALSALADAYDESFRALPG